MDFHVKDLSLFTGEVESTECIELILDDKALPSLYFGGPLACIDDIKELPGTLGTVGIEIVPL